MGGGQDCIADFNRGTNAVQTQRLTACQADSVNEDERLQGTALMASCTKDAKSKTDWWCDCMVTFRYTKAQFNAVVTDILWKSGDSSAKPRKSSLGQIMFQTQSVFKRMLTW